MRSGWAACYKQITCVVMNESELRKRMIELSKQAGFYKGLLEGTLMQCSKEGDRYIISSEVYRKVKKSLDNANNDFGL